MKKHFTIKIKDYLPIIIMLICAAVLGILMAKGVFNIKGIQNAVQGKPRIAFVIIVFLFTLKGISGVILYDLLVLMVAAVFRFPFSAAVLIVGTWLMLSASYFIGLRTSKERLAVLMEKNPKISKYIGIAIAYGGISCGILHMLGLNTEVLGVLFGALRIKYPVYIAGSIIGLAPCMFSLMMIGSTPDIRSVKFWVMIGIYILCAAAAFFYADHLSKKKKNT